MQCGHLITTIYRAVFCQKHQYQWCWHLWVLFSKWHLVWGRI